MRSEGRDRRELAWLAILEMIGFTTMVVAEMVAESWISEASTGFGLKTTCFAAEIDLGEEANSSTTDSADLEIAVIAAAVAAEVIA